MSTRLDTLRTISQAVDPLSTGPHALSVPITLGDGARTVIHLSVHARTTTEVRVAVFPGPERLLEWCLKNDIDYASTGGYFSRRDKRPLGEVWMGGVRTETTPFGGEKWAPKRGAIWADQGKLRIAPLEEMPDQPVGDLMTAGPILVRGGRSAITDDGDLEGIPETWQDELDDDWTRVRAQRTAIGYDKDHIWVMVADGQSSHVWEGFEDPTNKDAGLDLGELAELMLALGATDALNLDGGGGASLVHNGRLLNRPRAGRHDPEAIGEVMHSGRPIHSALVFQAK